MADKPGAIFRSNPSKDYLRAVYDKLLVGNWWCKRQSKPLHYLGLPGPDMLDIIEWQEYLGNFSTIEREERAQHLLFLKANVKDVEHRLHSLFGAFDSIILSGRDRYGHTPRWPYDVVNLDYFGGLLYANMRRPKALRKLIENQGNFKRSFLLIITNDLREVDRHEVKLEFLRDLERALVRDFGDRQSRIRIFVEAYRSQNTPTAARQALYTNHFLRDCGEMFGFRVQVRPPIVYAGTGGAQMIHYATDFDFQEANYRAVSEQSMAEVLNLGFSELRGREMKKAVVPLFAAERQ